MSRTTPDSADLMPEVLELLKREKRPIRTQAILVHMRTWIKRNRFDDRDRSIHWALNRLEKENYVGHPQRGIWRISKKGLGTTLTLEEARQIMHRCSEWERRNPKTRKL
jgi:hypothetical protein